MSIVIYEESKSGSRPSKHVFTYHPFWKNGTYKINKGRKTQKIEIIAACPMDTYKTDSHRNILFLYFMTVRPVSFSIFFFQKKDYLSTPSRSQPSLSDIRYLCFDFCATRTMKNATDKRIFPIHSIVLKSKVLLL